MNIQQETEIPDNTDNESLRDTSAVTEIHGNTDKKSTEHVGSDRYNRNQRNTDSNINRTHGSNRNDRNHRNAE